MSITNTKNVNRWQVTNRIQIITRKPITHLTYKRAGNLPFPTTKQLLLTRYHDTMMCGDAAVPVATAMAPLPHPT